MAQVYLCLYCVENSLRSFIELVARDKLGDDYFDQLTLNKDIKEKIASRKTQESTNRWLRLRGDSEIFYLNFEDLGTIIRNNWNIFSKYFPNQNWITTKIEDLAKCRNLVAHNSFVGDHERDLIRVYYTSILRQLDSILANRK